MTDRPGLSETPAPRRLACGRCGTEFSCELSGSCWCADEPARLPRPRADEDCLCRACLRAAASGAAGQADHTA